MYAYGQLVELLNKLFTACAGIDMFAPSAETWLMMPCAPAYRAGWVFGGSFVHNMSNVNTLVRLICESISIRAMCTLILLQLEALRSHPVLGDDEDIDGVSSVHVALTSSHKCLLQRLNG